MEKRVGGGGGTGDGGKDREMEGRIKPLPNEFTK